MIGNVKVGQIVSLVRMSHGWAAVLCLAAWLFAMPAAAQEQIVLTIAHAWPEVFMDERQSVFDKQFMEKYPHIKIEAENSGWGEFNEKYLVRAASGTLPDVVYVHPNWMPTWVAQNLYEELDPYIERTPSFGIDDFFPVILEPYRNAAGSQIALPYGAGTVVMYYNKDLFSRAGLAPVDYAWRWEHEFLDAAKRLTLLDPNSGAVVQSGFTGPNLDWQAEGVFYAPWGAGILDPSYGQGERSRLNETEALNALQFWVSLGQEYNVVGGDWLAGTAGMTVSGTWEIVTTNSAEAFDWDVAHVPSGPVAKSTSMSTGSGYAITTQSRNKDAAWLYLSEYLGSENMQFMWGETRRDPPARYSAIDSFVRQGGDPVSIEIFFSATEYALVRRVGGTHWGQMLSVHDQLINQALNGAISPQEALLNAHQQISILLAEQNNR